VMALIGGGADHQVRTSAGPRLAGITLRASVAVVTGTAIGLGGVRADAIGRVAGASDMALIGGGTSHRVAPRAAASLTGITLRAGVAVIAGTAVSLGRVGALASGRIAGARVVALIGGGTSHRIAARAATRLAGIGMRAGVAIVTGRAVSLGGGIALGPLIIGCAYLCPGALTVSCPCCAGSSQVKLFVHRCVAVIIYPVADLSRSWMDSGGAIITVDVIVNIPFGRSTRLRG